MTFGEIRERAAHMRAQNLAAAARLTDRVSAEDYRAQVRLARQGGETIEIWTDAFNRALREHEVLVIPAREEPYYIDASIIMPSNRRIEAEGARIRAVDGMDVLMLRSEHVRDGSRAPIAEGDADENISILGGRWEEPRTERAGYGRSGRIDEARSMHGVSTCMLFNNLSGLTLQHVTFSHCGAFAVQAGNLKNGVFEDVTFEHCFADGLHLNGNTDTVWIRDVRGYVGDDLVALNMYDWQDSSVNFGPTKTVWCENLTLSPESPYKALRIEPGVYYYDDGTSVDCSLHDAVFKNVRGVNTFKLYYQTPAYLVSESPERGGVGSGGDLYFEDIEIDLAAPIDRLPDYVNSDPVTGSFAAFELGSNLESLTLRNVRVRLHRDRYPMSFLVCAGPKSCRVGEKEIFDPYLSSETKRLVLEDITIDGEHPEDVASYVREIAFDDPARFACPPAAGRIREIEYRK